MTRRIPVRASQYAPKSANIVVADELRDLSTVDQRAVALWDRLDHALSQYLVYLDEVRTRETTCDLTIVDLLFIRNFKAGNSSITEHPGFIEERLGPYSNLLREIRNKHGSKQLKELTDAELDSAISLARNFLQLTLNDKTKIRGFGPSYASALLAAHFPNLYPVLDRRVLNGAGVDAAHDNNGQVRQIQTHYESLIMQFRMELGKMPTRTLREIDREWFVVPLPEAEHD